MSLDAENITADDRTSYNDCEANAVYMSIDTQDNDPGFTKAALPGKTSAETRRLIILATCATQYTHATNIIGIVKRAMGMGKRTRLTWENVPLSHIGAENKVSASPLTLPF